MQSLFRLYSCVFRKNVVSFPCICLLFYFCYPHALHGANKFSDVIKNASIDGHAVVLFNTIHGRDGAGSKYLFRFKPTITTGEVYGFSGSSGILFFKGGGTPDFANTHNDIGGSRGDMHASYSDRFNIADFYITYNTKDLLKTDTIIQLGQKTPGTPFNDKYLDRALGLFFENKDFSFANIYFQAWDTWMGDDIFCSRASGSINGSPGVNSQVGFGNNVFMLGIKGAIDFNSDSNLAYQVWYTYINRYIDAMTFGSIAYTHKFGNQSLSLLGQISFSALTDNPRLFSGDPQYTNLYSDKKYNYAKTRGMYNIRLDYEMQLLADKDSKSMAFVGAGLGFAGSFANGFGTLLDNTGGLKLSGMLFGGFSRADANGFGILGIGGFDKSSIIVPYFQIHGGYKKFTLQFNLVYVDATHFYHLKKASRNDAENLNGAKDKLYGASNHIKPAKFLETSLSAGYKFTESVNISIHYNHFFGNLELGRFRAQVGYLF